MSEVVKLTPHEMAILRPLLEKLDAVIVLGCAAGYNREICIETVDANPHARFTVNVEYLRILAKIGRSALEPS